MRRYVLKRLLVEEVPLGNVRRRRRRGGDEKGAGGVCRERLSETILF